LTGEISISMLDIREMHTLCLDVIPSLVRTRLSRFAVDGDADDAVFTEGSVTGAGSCFGALGDGWLLFTGEMTLGTDFLSNSSRFPTGAAG
jgi:hypothetical protein